MRELHGIRYKLRFVLWDVQLSIIFLLPSGCFLLTLLMTPIEAKLEFCATATAPHWKVMWTHLRKKRSERSETSAPNKVCRKQRGKHIHYFSPRPWCVLANEWLPGEGIDNLLLNAKSQGCEQYLAKQPRWSSDVIKALDQEALLLGTGADRSSSFPHTCGNGPLQSAFIWFQLIQTFIN